MQSLRKETPNKLFREKEREWKCTSCKQTKKYCFCLEAQGKKGKKWSGGKPEGGPESKRFD